MDSTLENDEREGLPSASGLEQLSLCPGSFNYQKLFPKLESDVATEGTIRHDLIEKVIVEDIALDDIEDEQQHECVVRAIDLLRKIEKEIGVGQFLTQKLETRLWVAFENGNKMYSTKYDLLRIYDNNIRLLVDWKTLYGEHTEASKNIQLLAQAVAVYTDLCVNSDTANEGKYFCALAEPFPSPTYSLVEYTPYRLDQAVDYLQGLVMRASGEDAERVPGIKQCKYCDGLAICPDARGVVTKAMNLKASKITPETLSEAMEIAQLADKWKDAVKTRTKELISDGTEVEGWKLRGSGNVKSLSSSHDTATSIMETNALTWEEYLGATDVKWGKLLKVWQKKREITRDKAVEELELILKDHLKEVPKAASLVKS